MTPSTTKPRRDARLDSLRGLMLVAMAINHVPSDYHWLTDRSLGIFSAAEGFVFLSGMIAGIVYTRKLRSVGQPGLRRLAVERTNRIYWWHVGALLGSLLVVQLSEYFFGFCSINSPQLFHRNPLLAVLLGGTMLYQPGLLDILPMYCAFVLLLPIVLPALERGQRRWVLGLSFLGWLAVQGAPSIDTIRFPPLNIGAFNWFAWQFLFVLGLVVGHAQTRPETQPRGPTPLRWLLMAPALALATYAWGIHHYHWGHPWSDRFFGIVLNKPALGALRLGDFLVAAYLISVLGSLVPRALQWPPLAFLGRYALQVMAIQTVAAIAINQFPSLARTPSGRAIGNLVLLAVMFAGAWVYARLAARPTANKGPAIPTLRLSSAPPQPS